MSKIKIQEVIVVEGKDDTANLRRFYEVDTYETRGSAINEDDLDFLAESAHADACAPGNPKDASVEDLKALFRKIM